MSLLTKASGPVRWLFSISSESDLVGVVRNERYFILVRWLGSALTAVLLPLLGLPTVLPMYGVIASALVYNLLLAYVVVPYFPAYLARGYLTGFLDAALTGMAVWATGGLDSSLYIIYFTLAVANVIRFGAFGVVFSTGTSIASYMAAILASGALVSMPVLAAVLVRMGWVGINGVFAGFIVERVKNAEKALASELRRTQALHQASSAPSTTLELDRVLQTVVDQACALVEADEGALQLEPGRQVAGSSSQERTLVESTNAAPSRNGNSLGQLIQNSRHLRHRVLDYEGPVDLNDLSDIVPLPGFSGPQATLPFGAFLGTSLACHGNRIGALVVAREANKAPFDTIDREAISAFAVRAALAIENARLYEDLADQVKELKRTQAQLVESAKLASIGTLAAGVAHEINNPLMAISGRTELLLSNPKQHLKSEKAEQYLEVIRDMTDRVTQVVRGLLAFSREEQESQAPVDVHRAIDETLSLVGSQLRMTHVQVKRDYCLETAEVLGNKNKLQQVFMNLILNAKDAMPEGGTLTISTAQNRSRLIVKLTDEGTGIPKDILGRIFDPFFTTKEVGKGTGLGLFVTRGIIEQHNGFVQVESAEGAGTTFSIYLPLI